MAIVDRLGTPLVQGPFRYNVRAAATGNVTLYGEQTIDGIDCTRGNRVLCVGQTAGAENGPWIVSSGQWSRPRDWVTEEDALSAIFVVTRRTGAEPAYAVSTSAPIIIGVTSITLIPASANGTPH